jgi:hypothetical protein
MVHEVEKGGSKGLVLLGPAVWRLGSGRQEKGFRMIGKQGRVVQKVGQSWFNR